MAATVVAMIVPVMLYTVGNRYIDRGVVRATDLKYALLTACAARDSWASGPWHDVDAGRSPAADRDHAG
jgi:hypothetical protein